MRKWKNSSYNQFLCSSTLLFFILSLFYTLLLALNSQQIGAVSMEEMPSTKYEIENFTGVNDFGLWRLKMKALLVHQGCLEALKGEVAMNVALSTAEKTNMIEKAHNTILLSLGDKVLWHVSKETTTSGLW